MYDMCLKACQDEFTPEFFNRLDDVIMFHPLTSSMILDVVKLEIVLLEERMHRLQANIRLMMEPPALKKLVKDGFDIRYGARPLKRKLESELVTPISSFLASKQLNKGDRVIVSLVGKGDSAEYAFEKVVEEEEVA
jgi:ATP-dependent Clp protease ATP-binding subunit ClpA